jgi:hypothetical protein
MTTHLRRVAINTGWRPVLLDERRSARGAAWKTGDATHTRQGGRVDARKVKRECLDANGNRTECRHEKRVVKEDAREKARDIKQHE